MGFKLVIKKGDAHCAKCGEALHGPWWGEKAGAVYCKPSHAPKERKRGRR